MRLSISHLTCYHYPAPARSNINELRLSPEENLRQTPGDHTIRIDPGAPLVETRDLFGNLVHHFEVEDRHGELTIHSSAEVETRSTFDLAMRAMSVPLREFQSEKHETLYEFTTDSTFVFKNPATWREAVDVHLSSEKTWGALMQGLSDYVFEYCHYEDQSIHGMATSVEIQECKTGTCQDFAHLMISYCRALGMPARYLSGYLYDPGLDPDLTPGTAAASIGSGATHAWVEVHVPSVGWVGIDPTNRRWIDEQYVSVSSGRDYHDVAPVRGSLIGGGEDRSLTVDVVVRALR